MLLSTYLFFNGRCEEAFKFYEQVLGGKIVAMLKHGETPAAAHVPPDKVNTIIHARLTVGDMVLMGSDDPSDPFKQPQGFSVSIGVDKIEDAERIFRELSENASIIMPIQETFWAHRFGMLVDRFGIPWMINCEKSA